MSYSCIPIAIPVSHRGGRVFFKKLSSPCEATDERTRVKIQSRKTLYFAGQFGAAITRTILATCKIREFIEDPTWHPFMGGRGRNFLLSTWHENLLVGAWYCGKFPHFHTLASPSRDGEIITGCASSLGMTVLRGSSNDGGVRALKQIVDESKSKKRFRFGFTPDGPRGPRREIKFGVAYVAAKSGLPVVSMGIACENGWRAPSWDKLQVPLPFTKVQIVVTAPIWSPPNASRDQMEAFSARIADEMNRSHEIADRLLKNPIVGERRRTGEIRRAA
jgi:lysophospholipid acyltransferase (LPLAT)-like uncharacterized protein